MSPVLLSYLLKLYSLIVIKINKLITLLAVNCVFGTQESIWYSSNKTLRLTD